MKGVLILAHGSREKETEKTLYKVVEFLEKKVENHVLEVAFLHFSEITLEKGLDNLKEKNVTDIILVPYFLFEGVHIREDVPKKIREYEKKNQGIKIKISKMLGDDERLADILADRINTEL